MGLRERRARALGRTAREVLPRLPDRPLERSDVSGNTRTYQADAADVAAGDEAKLRALCGSAERRAAPLRSDVPDRARAGLDPVPQLDLARTPPTKWALRTRARAVPDEGQGFDARASLVAMAVPRERG